MLFGGLSQADASLTILNLAHSSTSVAASTNSGADDDGGREGTCLLPEASARSGFLCALFLASEPEILAY